MKILLTGKNGQVGWELQKTLATLGEVIAPDRHQMNLAKPDSMRAVIRDVKPQLIVNPAAYTSVDKAESEPELAMAVNGLAPGIMAEEAKRLGAAIIHYSTDYVFDGAKATPYTEEDIPNPLNVYGQTKLAGEKAIMAVGLPYLILRTSWVYASRGNNFVKTILRLAAERAELRVIADQFGAPTSASLIAVVTAQLICRGQMQSDRTGLYHLTATGQTTWHGFAKSIVESAGLQSPPQVTAITTAEYPMPASRPRMSSLHCNKLMQDFDVRLPDWQSCLDIVMGERVCN